MSYQNDHTAELETDQDGENLSVNDIAEQQ